MDQKELERIKIIYEKYHDFIFSLPGIMGAGYGDKEISIDLTPEKLELGKQFVSDNLDGVPVKIKPRSDPPVFFHCNDCD